MTVAHEPPPEDGVRQQLINRLTRRAWLDQAFRDLLVADPDAAAREEFEEIPRELEGFSIRPVPVDRATLREKAGRRTLRIRPKSGREPISLVLRDFLGERELIVVLYTRRCAFACSFCTLPSAGAITDVSGSEIAEQLRVVKEFTDTQESGIRRVALGNEGSFLDQRTLPDDQFALVMETVRGISGVEELIIETRPEFVTEESLARLAKLAAGYRITLKIGLESSDDRIREEILTKWMPLEVFDKAVGLAGVYGFAMETYVLLKADPQHTDRDGRLDAIATSKYVSRLCVEHGVPLTLRINSMYMAAGSRWQTKAEEAGWSPPSVFDIAEVMWSVRGVGTRVFAGLSEEGLATAEGHFVARNDFAPWANRKLEHFNATGDLDSLRSVALFRGDEGR